MMKWFSLLAALAVVSANPQIPLSGSIGSISPIGGFGSSITPLGVSSLGGFSSGISSGGLSSGGVIGLDGISDSSFSGLSSFGSSGLSGLSGGLQSLAAPGVKVVGVQRLPDSGDISGASLSGISSLSGSGLSGLSSLSGSGLSGLSSLSGSSLSGGLSSSGLSSLSGSSLSGGLSSSGLSSLSGSSLSGGLSGAGLSGAGLSGAGLSGSSLSGGLSEAELAAAGLSSAQIASLGNLGGTVTKIERISSSGATSGDISGELPASTLQQILKGTGGQLAGPLGGQISGERITQITRIGGQSGRTQGTTVSPISTTTGFTTLGGQGSTTGFGTSTFGSTSQSGFGSGGTRTVAYGDGVTRPLGASGGSITTTESAYYSTTGSSSRGQGLGAQGAGFGAQGAGFGAQGAGFGAQGSGFGARRTGFGSQSSRFGSSTTSFGSQGSRFGAQGAGFGVGAPGGVQRTVTRVQETYSTSGQGGLGAQGLGVTGSGAQRFGASRFGVSGSRTSFGSQASRQGSAGGRVTYGSGVSRPLGGSGGSITTTESAFYSSGAQGGAGFPVTTLRPVTGSFQTTNSLLSSQAPGVALISQPGGVAGEVQRTVTNVQESFSSQSGQSGLGLGGLTTLAPTTLGNSAFAKSQENALLNAEGVQLTGSFNPLLSQKKVTTTTFTSEGISGSSGLGGAGLSASGLDAASLEAASLGAAGLGAAGLGAAGLGAAGLGASGLGGSSGSSTYKSSSFNYNSGSGYGAGATYGLGSGAGSGASGLYKSTGLEGKYAILRQLQGLKADGTYQWTYETENGIQAQESGEVKGTDEEGTIESVTGSYSYVAPDGQRITVNYIADENGFRAVGDHIPKTPAHVLRTLEYLSKFPH